MSRKDTGLSLIPSHPLLPVLDKKAGAILVGVTGWGGVKAHIGKALSFLTSPRHSWQDKSCCRERSDDDPRGSRWVRRGKIVSPTCVITHSFTTQVAICKVGKPTHRSQPPIVITFLNPWVEKFTHKFHNIDHRVSQVAENNTMCQTGCLY